MWHSNVPSIDAPRVRNVGNDPAILGDDRPYLFFWQASEEVEEERAMGRSGRERIGATREEILGRRLDVGVGTLFCNVTFFFITLTTALTLHQHGITRPETTTEVASALRPIAGSFATQLYTIGILGTGAGDSSPFRRLAFAELFGGGQNGRTSSRARGFYGVFALHRSAMLSVFRPGRSGLYLSCNHQWAPRAVLLAVLAVASDRRVMGERPALAGSLPFRHQVAMLSAARNGPLLVMRQRY
jgi:hypothetical protein